MVLKDSVINFFKKHYDVDVSYVEVNVTKMDNCVGFYDPCNDAAIDVSRDIADKGGIGLEMVMVHEVNHLLQHTKEKGLTMDMDKLIEKFGYAAKYFNVSDWDDLSELDGNSTDYYNLHIEIDSRLCEALFIYEELGEEGLLAVVPYVFRCGTTVNLQERILAMPCGAARDVLLKRFNEGGTCNE